jgi:predicted Co/Zn/Cd cation transporter (cation efflux family)
MIMNPYLETAVAVAVIIGHGLRVTISWALYPFTPIWYIIYIICLPVLHVIQAIWAILMYPLQLFPGSLVEV